MQHRAYAKSAAFMALLPALLLAGCGSSASERAMEARIAAAEAKAEAADKRSRAALSMAASGSGSQSMPVDDSVVDAGDAPMDSGVTDDSPDSAIYDNQMESPPSPPIGPAG